MSLLRDVVDRVFFPNREAHAVPVLDGPFSPNSRLDDARVLGAPLPAVDDFVPGPDGALYASSGEGVWRCEGPDYGERSLFAKLPAQVGGLAWTRDGRLLACVAGAGVLALSARGEVLGRLDTVDGTAIACPTAVTVAADGAVYICDGSRHHAFPDWLPDLLQRRPPSGRLISCQPDLSRPKLIADGLDWPAGVAVSHDGARLMVSESWVHRLSTFALANGQQRIVVNNYAGYPARIATDPTGGYWMAFFGMRTQLIEFILREREFTDAMMAKVPRALWIGPKVEGGFDYREPTQIGRIKKLGIQKPWAPPRAYGLVARLADSGEAQASFHSRVDGRLHGMTSVRRVGERVLAASKGRDVLVALATSTS